MLLGRELEALALQAAVDLAHVAQRVAPLGGRGPRLHQLEHLALDVVVRGHVRGRVEEGSQVVEELARRNLLDEVRAAVLDARIGELEPVSACACVLVWACLTFSAASWTLGFL